MRSVAGNGADQESPWSPEYETRMSVVPPAVKSIQEQYRRPRWGALEGSAAQLGQTRAPRKLSAGRAMSKGIRLAATTRWRAQVTPPSKERLKAIVLAW